MERPGGGCDIVGLTKEMWDIGDRFVDDARNKKRFGKESTNIVKTVFEDVFSLPFDARKGVNFTKGSLKSFERKLNEVKFASDKGILTSKFGSIFYTPQAIATKNPQLMKLMNDLHNTNLNYTGRIGRHNRSYERILDSFKKEQLIQVYGDQVQSTMPKEWSISKKIAKATKLANKHEEIVQKLVIDSKNEVPGAADKLTNALAAETEFYLKKEGKVFQDMLETIEVTLPKIEQDAYKAWKKDAPTYQKQLVQGKLSKEKYYSIRSKALEPVLAKKIKSAPMREAVAEYMELMDNVYVTLENGIDAYVGSLKAGMKGKYDSAKIDEIAAKIKLKIQPDKATGYYPHYRRVLSIDYLDNIMPYMQRVSDAVTESLSSKTGSVNEAVEALNGYVSGKSKSRQLLGPNTPTDVKNEYSKNFFVNIKRYTDEIDRFNMIAHADKYTRESLNAAKEMFKTGEPIDGYGRATVEMMVDMNRRMKGGYGFENVNTEAAMKTLLALEFTSKLGFNLRSPIKNATQGLLNMVEFGPVVMAKARKFYQKRDGLSAEVRAMMDEAGFLFTDDAAPELIEAKFLGKSMAQKIKINKNEEIEFIKPSIFAGTHSKVSKLAGVSGRFMSKVENFNRKTTFKTAFYKMFEQLSTSTEYTEALRLQGKTEGEIKREIKTRARNYALRKTTLLHFDYADIAKSSWLTHPTGRLLGQFQHYGFKFFEYNMNLAKNGKDDILAGEVTGPRAMKAYKMGMIYGLAPVIASAVTNLDWTNIIQHDSKDKIAKLWTLFTGDDEEVKDAYYGKGVLTQLPFIGAPLFSDAMALGNLYGFLDMDDDDKEKLLAGWEDYALSSKDQKAYETLRILNTSLSRLAYKTIPKFLDNPGDAILYESGFYKTDKVKEIRKSLFKNTLEKKAILPKEVLDALNAIGGHINEATGKVELEKTKAYQPKNYSGSKSNYLVNRDNNGNLIK